MTLSDEVRAIGWAFRNKSSMRRIESLADRVRNLENRNNQLEAQTERNRQAYDLLENITHNHFKYALVDDSWWNAAKELCGVKEK
jgi:hypothetical protein